MKRLALRCSAGLQGLATRRSASKVGLVLGYHGVAPVAGDPRRELVPALAASIFRGQLDHVRRYYDVVSIDDLRARIAARAPGEPVPVAITFDDDLSCHVQYAAPALLERSMPAAFFLTGRTLDGARAFWWQDLQLVADRGPEALEQARDRLAQRWPWAAERGDIHALARTIEGLRATDRRAVEAELRQIAGEAVPEPGLSAAAVRELASAGLNIGFHTGDHDALQTLDADELAEAMRAGAPELEAVVGGPLTAIGYPHGRADMRVAHAAREAGYKLGFTWTGGAVRDDDSPLLVDRVDTWADSVDAFAWRIARAAARRG